MNVYTSNSIYEVLFLKTQVQVTRIAERQKGSKVSLDNVMRGIGLVCAIERPMQLIGENGQVIFTSSAVRMMKG